MTRILIAEDEQNIRNLIVLTLNLHQFDVTPTKNGAEALAEAAQDATYDLIMLDVRMPQMGGHEAAHKIRALPHHANTPILFLSGDTIAATKLENSYTLIKPFALDKLIGQIKKVINSA